MYDEDLSGLKSNIPESMRPVLPDFASIQNPEKRIDAMVSYADDNRNVVPETSFNIGDEALKLARKINYRKGIALSLMVKSFQHWIQSDIDTALEELDESEEIQEEIGYFDKWGESEMIRAMATWGRGNYDVAFELVYNAINKVEENGAAEGLGWLNWTLGVFHFDLKDFKRSLQHYEKALPIFTSINPRDGNTMSYTLIGVGSCYRGLGETDLAQKTFNEALQISVETRQWMQEARCHYELGLLALDRNDLVTALSEHQACLSMRRDHAMISSLLALCNVTMAQGEYERSMAYAEEALDLALETGSKPKEYLCHQMLATLYKKKGDYKSALDHNERFHLLKSDVVGERASNKLKDLETKYATEKSEREKEIHRLKHVELKKAHDEIAEKNREILDSIRYAKRIQTAILPSQKLVRDCFVLYKPKDVVAGDFYWMERKEDKILFAAADCTGHGVPGAMVSVVCHNGLNRAVREFGLTDPGGILDKTRDIVIKEFEKSEDEVKDGMDIALCCLDDMNLKYAGANNPLWLIRDGDLMEYKADKQPIGRFDHPSPYTTHALELKKGDAFYIFSDGLVDQFGGPKGRKFMARKFKELLLGIQNLGMEEQKDAIEGSFDEWRGAEEQVDDLCVIGVKVQG